MENMTVYDIVRATNGKLICGDGNRKITSLGIDSRKMKAGDLFIPLAGEKVDAHKFIVQSLLLGAEATLTSRHISLEEVEKAVEEKRELWPETMADKKSLTEEKAWIYVEDTKKALQDIGSFYRGRLTLPLVGVTGSVGKTTTREMIGAALGARYQVYKTPANHNSQIGVPITISGIGSKDEIGVLELGMSEPGEMTVIAKIARIDMAVITNVGVTHIEQLGTRENILKEKLSIQDGLKEGGVLFLNGDNDLLMNVKGRPDVETVYYGTGENCDYRAVDIQMREGCPSFTLEHKGKRIPVSLNVMGEHNVLNGAVALAVADRYGIPMEAAAAALESFEGFQNRLKVYKSDRITVIDDTYNASPDSMKAALKVLASTLADGKRIAVLADMKELGENAGKFHYEVGAFASELSVDVVFTLGELAAMIGRGIEDKGDHILVSPFEESDRQLMVKELEQTLKNGDAILFKGSNSMKLGEVASYFIRRDEAR